MDNFVMVVDDSPTIRKIVEMTLQGAGYRGVSFADGVRALKWLGEHAEMRPGLVFLDVHMSGIDGYEWARQVKSKARFHWTSIVLMSGEAFDREKGRVAGVASYLAKPFTTQALLATTQRYLVPMGLLR
jgi:twitching motility two-component system response regulator PilG